MISCFMFQGDRERERERESTLKDFQPGLTSSILPRLP